MFGLEQRATEQPGRFGTSSSSHHNSLDGRARSNSEGNARSAQNCWRVDDKGVLELAGLDKKWRNSEGLGWIESIPAAQKQEVEMILGLAMSFFRLT